MIVEFGLAEVRRLAKDPEQLDKIIDEAFEMIKNKK
jgi:hypothetical protein